MSNRAAAELERSPSRAANGNASRPTARKLAPSERLLGQKVTIRLRSGESFEGRYVNGSRYEMQLVIDDRRVVIFKHAVEWMAEAGDKPSNQSMGEGRATVLGAR